MPAVSSSAFSSESFLQKLELNPFVRKKERENGGRVERRKERKKLSKVLMIYHNKFELMFLK